MDAGDLWKAHYVNEAKSLFFSKHTTLLQRGVMGVVMGILYAYLEGCKLLSLGAGGYVLAVVH